MKIIYVAGKFRGKNAWEVFKNVRAAEEVAFQVASLGAMPLTPHLNTANFDGTLDDKFWLDGTMELLRRCDAVMMVPGWETSTGATAERREAERLGLPIFEHRSPTSGVELRAWILAAAYREPRFDGGR